MIADIGPAALVVALLAVSILGLSKGGFAGVGMVSTPMLALLVGPLEAASFMLPIMIVQDCIAVFFYRRTFDRRALLELLPGAVLGVAAAYVFAASMSEWVVQIVLGLLSLLFALRELHRHLVTRSLRAPLPGDTRLLGWISGAAAGFTSAVAHAGSPPFQFYAVLRGLQKQDYVGTSVMFFATVNLIKIPSFVALGQMSWPMLVLSALFMPVAIASSWAGVVLVRRIDAAQFNAAISVILLAVSAMLLAQGTLGYLAH